MHLAKCHVLRPPHARAAWLHHPHAGPGQLDSAHAWANHLDDHSRRLVEWAADTVRGLCAKNAQLAHDRDQAEADAAHLFQLHFGPQKGGAA